MTRDLLSLTTTPDPRGVNTFEFMDAVRAAASGSRRGEQVGRVDLFEYQGKQYFARWGIPVSAGGVADTVDEAVAQAERAGYPVVVKAQVQVGGRGKAGGIKLAPERRPRCASTPPRSWGWTSGGTWCAGCGWSTPRTSPRSTTPPSPSTARPACTWGWSPPRGASTSSRWPRKTRRPWPGCTSTRWTGLTEARARATWSSGPGSTRQARDGAVDILLEALPLLRRGGRLPGGDQPPDPDPGRAGARPGRQGQPGRQRRLPPSGVGGVPGGAGARPAGRSWPRRRGCSTSGCRAAWASSPTAPAWR